MLSLRGVDLILYILFFLPQHWVLNLIPVLEPKKTAPDLGRKRLTTIFTSIRNRPLLILVSLSTVWVMLYMSLFPFATFFVRRIGVDPHSSIGQALAFFVYDAPKVLLLLTGVVFLMGVINTWFTPERTRALLSGRTPGLANMLAASLGVVTPFCSCSAVPLFVGFIQAGIPLGVSLSFLIAAPLVNEVALTLLFGLFGWRIALLYLALGLFIAVVAGWFMGQLRLERYLEKWVQDIPKKAPVFQSVGQTLSERLNGGYDSVKDIVGKLWLFIVLGIAVGAFIHGYVPSGLMARFMGKDVWWSVPLAVIIGVPMYSSAAGIIPVVQALLAKGAALGTSLAFMMSVIALSLPELIILRKVLSLRLIGVFVSTVAMGILLVGIVFNLVFVGDVQMNDIKILGVGCAKCESTYALFEEVAQEKWKTIKLEKVDEIMEIMAYDVMSTPGVVINGALVHRGSVSSRELVEAWLDED